MHFLRILLTTVLAATAFYAVACGPGNVPSTTETAAVTHTETATATFTPTPVSTTTPTPEPTAEPTPEPTELPLCDGLGHCWRWGAWRNADDSAWVPPVTTAAVYASGNGASSVPRGGANEALVISIAQTLVPDHWRAAVRVAWCESGFDPGATGSAGERGLWQIHPLHSDSTYDPWGNGAAMVRISGGGVSWSAWAGGRGVAWAQGADCSPSRPGWPG